MVKNEKSNPVPLEAADTVLGEVNEAKKSVMGFAGELEDGDVSAEDGVAVGLDDGAVTCLGVDAAAWALATAAAACAGVCGATSEVFGVKGVPGPEGVVGVVTDIPCADVQNGKFGFGLTPGVGYWQCCTPVNGSHS